jgi:hypothetical protein
MEHFKSNIDAAHKTNSTKAVLPPVFAAYYLGLMELMEKGQLNAETFAKLSEDNDVLAGLALGQGFKPKKGSILMTRSPCRPKRKNPTYWLELFTTKGENQKVKRLLAIVTVLLVTTASGANADSDFVLVSCVRSFFGPCAPLPSLLYPANTGGCEAAREQLRAQMGAGNVSAACLPVDSQWNRVLFPK